MMTGSERRTAIINQIKNSTVPVSGKALAAQYAVSRQVIVQDIALIRAAGHEIISTNRGYLLNEDASVQRTFKVKHTDAQVEEELYSIVDLGGSVKNVMVNHRAYGHMEAELNITSRRKAAEFVVEADSEETLDMIEAALREKGFLLEQEEWEKKQYYV